MTNLYLDGDDKYTDENGATYDTEPTVPNHTTDEHDRTYENEGSRDLSPMVQISIKEYDRLKERTKYITDKDMIAQIDKIEFFVKELRKHIVRTDI
jgi:hypothetical protein|tara:strand:- start:156 stop:443 length:288 start_codon:yes stop_codon:yes gene_type:complete